MDTSLNIQPATPETVWAILREIGEKQAGLAESQAETDRQMKETDRKMKETDRKIADLAEKQAETDRLIKETGKQIKETGKQIKETDKQIKKTGKQIKETGKQMKETRRNIDDTWKQIKETNKQLGNITNNQGFFAEEYFFNSFEQGKRNFFGEKFDDIIKNLRGLKTKDEFDIVMLNGHSVGIVEVKYKGHKNDVPEVVEKANKFRTNFAEYKNHAIYIGLATMAFYTELEQACQEHGIAIIKQSGDTVVINDEHLKAY